MQLQLNLHDLKIKEYQHVFSRNRSTVSAFLSVSQNWFNAKDNVKNGRMGVHVLFEDFQNAFDLVDYGILLRKIYLQSH